MNKLLLACAFLFSGSVLAQTIGPAGCGLGNMALGGSEHQIFASTTNGISGNQTFGITSGTSNCVDGSGTARLEAFIEGNRVALETEAARGEGETVESLAQILKCPSTDKVGAVLKSSYTEIFSTPNASASEVGGKVMEVLKSNEVLCLSQG